MSVNYSYKDIECSQILFNKNDDCYTDGNIIIPDSMDDIAKIISVTSSASVSNSKCEDNCLTISGKVKLYVLYIGENDPDKICSLTTSHPFTHSVKMNVTNIFTPLVKVSSASLTYSIVNSRRLKTTTRISFCISVFKNETLHLLSDAPGAETKTSEHTVSYAKLILQKNLIVNENCEIPPGKGEVDTILKYTVRISDSDFKVLTNKIIAKGNLSASVLYSSADSIQETAFTIPFTEVIDAEGINPSYKTNLTLTIADCDIIPDTDLSGEYRMLDITVILSCCITAFCRDNISVVSDIYLPKYSLDTKTSSITLHDALSECREEEFVKDVITIPNISGPIVQVIDVSCGINDTTFDSDTAQALAEIVIIYKTESAINSYTAKIPVTHKYSIKNPVNPHCEIVHTGYAITGSDSVDIRIGINFLATDVCGESINIINDCIEKETPPKNRSSIIVSVVSEGDSMWDIAKKYNISTHSLASANAMDDDASLKVGDKLLIPR